MTGRPPPFRRGERLSAERLNDALDARLVRGTGGGGAQTHNSGDEATVHVNPQELHKHFPKHICQMIVKSVEADHYICRSWDGTNEGTIDIKVAK